MIHPFNMLKTIMVWYKQLIISRHVVIMFWMLLLVQCLINTKADITQQQATPKKTQVETSTTTQAKSSIISNTVNLKKSGENNNHKKYRIAGKTIDLVNDFRLINNTLEEEGINSSKTGEDDENRRTFNYSMNNYVIVKPVIGLSNYSDSSLNRIKNLYIGYRKNSSSQDEESGEEIQGNNNAENSDPEVISGDMNFFYKSEFEKWNDRRLMDGMLCINDSQCQWMDEKLRCKMDIQLNFNANEEWLDVSYQNLSLGVCFCAYYHVWSERDMECWHPEAPAIPPPWAIAIAVGVVLLLIVKLAILLKLMI